MIVILFRHGHKEFSADENPSLSVKGFEQAQNLGRLIQNRTLPTPTHCWYSEKIRTKQTLQGCLKNGEILVHQKSELNCREHNEDHKSFRNRIQKFLLDLKQRAHQNEIHFVCSHYDWIEESMTLMDSSRDLNTSDLSSWAPGQYVYFDVHDQLYHYIKKGVL